MSEHERGTGERAVSDVLGFVLVFSLIVMVLGFVYVGGMGALQDARQAEQANNAERALEVFATNTEDVVLGGASSRGTEMQLGNAQLGYGDAVSFNVSIAETGQSFSATITPVVYETTEGTKILYVNGAVIRGQKNGAVLLREPGFLFGNRTVVPYLVTRQTGKPGMGGGGRVFVRTEAARRNVHEYTNQTGGAYSVTLNVTSPRAAVWERHFETRQGVTCDVVTTGTGEPTATCKFDSQRIYVQVVRLNIEIR